MKTYNHHTTQEMDIYTYYSNTHNNKKKYHIINNHKAPADITHLLNLGEKFIPRQTQLKKKLIKSHVRRLRKDVQTLSSKVTPPKVITFQTYTLEKEEFNPSEAGQEIEQALSI